MSEFREEEDSMGPVQIPSEMLYGAQTERARQNFQISGHRFERRQPAGTARQGSGAGE